MNARRIVVLFLGLLLAALPAAAQSSTDGWYLDPPETSRDLAGSGGNEGDAGSPWPGGDAAIRIVPRRQQAEAMAAAALPLDRGVLLAWPAWDGHDTEIVVALLAGGRGARSFPVTRNGGRDEGPVLLARDGTIQLAWIHREGGRSSLRAVRLAPSGEPAGEPRLLGPAGRERLAGVLPGGRVVALVRRGPAGRSRLELVVEGEGRRPVARLGREGALLSAAPGPGGTLVFRFRDGTLTGSLTVDAEGRVRGLAWE